MSPGKLFAMLMDNEQKSHWLKQGVHAEHQSESIERLEKAMEAQSRTLRLQIRRNSGGNQPRNWITYDHRGGQRAGYNGNRRSKISKNQNNRKNYNNKNKGTKISYPDITFQNYTKNKICVNKNFTTL